VIYDIRHVTTYEYENPVSFAAARCDWSPEAAAARI